MPPHPRLLRPSHVAERRRVTNRVFGAMPPSDDLHQFCQLSLPPRGRGGIQTQTSFVTRRNLAAIAVTLCCANARFSGDDTLLSTHTDFRPWYGIVYTQDRSDQ